ARYVTVGCEWNNGLAARQIPPYNCIIATAHRRARAISISPSARDRPAELRGMTIEHHIGDEVSTPAEVRSVLGNVLASEMLRGSPQLAAFLRFVVEAVLRGESNRIKGYTIGVE